MAEEIEKREGQEEKPHLEKPLEEMTITELRDKAKDIPELTDVGTMKKEELLATLKKQPDSEEKSLTEKPSEKPIDKMTATELREIALEIPGVTGVHAMKKEQLLVIIKEHRGIKDEERETKKKKKAVKPSLNARGLKEKIAKLRGEKQTARESKNLKKVDMLRRRINRLKKQTRKVAQG